MPRVKLPTIGPHDLEWVIDSPAFSSLTADSLGGDFGDGDPIDKQLLDIVAAVNADIASLPNLDVQLLAMDYLDGHFELDNYGALAQTVGALIVAGDPLRDATVANLAAGIGNDFHPSGGGGGSGSPNPPG
jgi:hypothetical protein